MLAGTYFEFISVMSPGVTHCVFTVKASICAGGCGWRLQDLEATSQALLRESIDGAFEIQPLWVPALVEFASQLTKDTSGDEARLYTQRKLVLSLLDGEGYKHPGKKIRRRRGDYLGEDLLDYGQEEVAKILKACAPAAVQAVRALRIALASS